MDRTSMVIGWLMGRRIAGQRRKEVKGYLYRTGTNRVVSYNGNEFPDIEHVWTDKETYPYACISNVLTPLGSTVCLALTQTAPYYDSSTGKVYFNTPNRRYLGASGGWGSPNDEDVSWALPIDENNCMVWTSHDILYKDSTEVFMAASDPVVTYPDAEYFVDGIGYKDMVLPKLPERDKEKYPYAVVRLSDNEVGTDSVTVYFLSELKTAGGTSGYTLHYNEGDMRYVSERESSDPNGYFPEFVEGETLTANGWTSLDNVIWSETDLRLPNGTLFLAGSEPAPFTGSLSGNVVGYWYWYPNTYSGIQNLLPELPERDKETYPYAFLLVNMLAARCTLILTDQPLRIVLNEDGSAGDFESGACNWMKYGLDESGTSWAFKTSGNSYYSQGFDGVWWSDFDMYYTDGTIYKEAVEPVPIYEHTINK